MGRYWPGPRHNVGIACGPSGLLVVDLDTEAHGGTLPPEWTAIPGVRSGADVLAVLADRAGQRWPCTYTVRTPSGGLHLSAVGTAPRKSAARQSASSPG